MRGAKQKKMFEISDLRRREILHLSVCFSPEGGGGGGKGRGYSIFSYMHFNIFGCFQKTEYFWGFEDFVDIF